MKNEMYQLLCLLIKKSLPYEVGKGLTTFYNWESKDLEV